MVGEVVDCKLAKKTGYYRCVNTGQTKHLQSGEPLPLSTTENHDWRFFKGDNIEPKDAITILVNKGIHHAIVTDELPEQGSFLNILARPQMGDIVTGKHQITKIDEDFPWGGESFLHITVSRVGELDEEMPVHLAIPINC